MTIGKASGEGPREGFKTARPRITFVLSYSSYQLEIRAVNNASTSPALRCPIRRRDNRLGEQLFVCLPLLRSLQGERGPTEVCGLPPSQVPEPRAPT